MTTTEQEQREGELRWREDCAAKGMSLLITYRIAVYDMHILPMQIGG